MTVPQRAAGQGTKHRPCLSRRSCRRRGAAPSSITGRRSATSGRQRAATRTPTGTGPTRSSLRRIPGTSRCASVRVRPAAHPAPPLQPRPRGVGEDPSGPAVLRGVVGSSERALGPMLRPCLQAQEPDSNRPLQGRVRSLAPQRERGESEASWKVEIGIGVLGRGVVLRWGAALRWKALPSARVHPASCSGRAGDPSRPGAGAAAAPAEPADLARAERVKVEAGPGCCGSSPGSGDQRVWSPPRGSRAPPPPALPAPARGFLTFPAWVLRPCSPHLATPSLPYAPF